MMLLSSAFSGRVTQGFRTPPKAIFPTVSKKGLRGA